ncbi:ATP-grasp domain-containing protein [Jatrophihabitans sp. DSM 45814]
MTPQIAIATCDELLPRGDSGDFALLDALASRGLVTDVVAWSDPAVRWNCFDMTVVRSTWDYTNRRAEFLRWLPKVPNLQNPASVLAANSDKRYLHALAAAGLPVVPTTFVAPGEPIDLPASGQFVVKPSVGAGSRGAGRFDAASSSERDRALAHADQLHAAGRSLLIQPYLEQVDEDGETALIYLDGEFSHSIRKGPMLERGAGSAVDDQALFLAENISARTPTQAELEVGDQLLAHLTPDGPLLYARIDLLPSSAGPVLIEAELTEPSLFLDFSTHAADRLADAIVRRLR